MKKYVLDSHAILTYLTDQTGNNVVEALLLEAEQGKAELLLSVINLGEVAYIIERRLGRSQRNLILMNIEVLPVKLIDASKDLALKAAALKARYGIAFADCFAAALAQWFGASVLTGDPEFKKIQDVVPVEWLKKS